MEKSFYVYISRDPLDILFQPAARAARVGWSRKVAGFKLAFDAKGIATIGVKMYKRNSGPCKKGIDPYSQNIKVVGLAKKGLPLMCKM